MPAISFLPFLQNIPLGTKVITAVLLLASSAGIYVSTLAAQNSPHPGLIGSQLPYLLLVPGESWKFPWVLLTAGFIELSLLEVSRRAKSTSSLEGFHDDSEADCPSSCLPRCRSSWRRGTSSGYGVSRSCAASRRLSSSGPT